MNRYVVAVSKGEDKFSLLVDVLEKSHFFNALESELSDSGKSKNDFSIVVKPNLMIFTHKEEPPVVCTDPELVECLIGMLHDRGYRNVKMAEAQNIFGNWYENRTVKNVAKAAGYDPEKYGYEICDLTEDVLEHDYGGKLQRHIVGRVWKAADFRISFAKNKTDIANLYTLTLKNIYGTLPAQDKGEEYHAKREWYEVAVDNLRNFPVHFGIIDAFYSSDGLLGFKGTVLPKHTKMLLASPSLIAVDMIAGRMMGVNPERSILTKLAIKTLGRPEIELVGIDQSYRHPNWDNLTIKGRVARSLFDLITRITGRRPDVPYVLRKSYLYHLLQEEVPELWQRILDVLEESYLGFNIAGIITDGLVGDRMDTSLFPRKRKLPESILKKSKEDLEDIVRNRKRRRELLRDLYENLFEEESS